jgi:hypothetical protein
MFSITEMSAQVAAMYVSDHIFTANQSLSVLAAIGKSAQDDVFRNEDTVDGQRFAIFLFLITVYDFTDLSYGESTNDAHKEIMRVKQPNAKEIAFYCMAALQHLNHNVDEKTNDWKVGFLAAVASVSSILFKEMTKGGKNGK